MSKQRATLASLLLLIVILVLYVWQIEPRNITVTRIDLPPRLAEAFAGQKIAFIADLHITADWRKEKALLARLSEIKPDYLLIGGDLVWYQRSVSPAVEFLKKLPPTKGSFVVLGDSDYMGRVRNCAYCHVPGSRELRTDLPVTFLRNEALEIADGKAMLVGLDGEDDSGWDAACAENITPDLPSLVLVHYPEAADRVAAYRPDLVLAGDTHGGQVAGVDRLGEIIHGPMPYPQGWFEVDGTPLFVTRGIGESLLPVRFGRPPEIVVLRGKR